MDCVDDPDKWTPFKLTYVVYPKGDKFGELFAAVSLTPFVILVGFATLILFRRDLHTMFFAAGLFVNEALNWVLKHWLKEQRPCLGRKIWVEFGMPSSHAQFMWFFTLYMLLFLSIRLNRPSAVYAGRDFCWKLFAFVISLTISIVVSYGRIYLGYHTWRQLLFGSFIGCASGGVWFCLVHWILTPIFPWITSLYMQNCNILQLFAKTQILFHI